MRWRNARPCLNRSGHAAVRTTQARVEAVGRGELRRFEGRVIERRARLAAALARFTAVCDADATVRDVYVFGSFATGRIGPTSDLDLLVVRDTALPRHACADDLTSAGWDGVPLDVIVVTPDEFRDLLPTSTFGAMILATMRAVDAT